MKYSNFHIFGKLSRTDMSNNHVPFESSFRCHGFDSVRIGAVSDQFGRTCESRSLSCFGRPGSGMFSVRCVLRGKENCCLCNTLLRCEPEVLVLRLPDLHFCLYNRRPVYPSIVTDLARVKHLLEIWSKLIRLGYHFVPACRQPRPCYGRRSHGGSYWQGRVPRRGCFGKT